LRGCAFQHGGRTGLSKRNSSEDYQGTTSAVSRLAKAKPGCQRNLAAVLWSGTAKVEYQCSKAASLKQQIGGA
jgi:hypothetical protein